MAATSASDPREVDPGVRRLLRAGMREAEIEDRERDESAVKMDIQKEPHSLGRVTLRAAHKGTFAQFQRSERFGGRDGANDLQQIPFLH